MNGYPESEISAYLKKSKVRKAERRGVAIFKVWKWAKEKSEPISLPDAIERFRKDRSRQMTKAEISWSLEKLDFLELIEYADAVPNSGTISERSEQDG